MKFGGSLVTAAVAVVLVVGATYLQGRMTDRWTGRNVSGELRKAAELLEAGFPSRCGDWEAEEDLPSDPRELQRAGAVGHVSRSYRNKKTKAKLSAFVVCATPRDASGHTPDRCYPGAGFEIAEMEHRLPLQLGDGRTGEAFTGTFRKSGQVLRVFWTYGVGGRWTAPQLARIELADAAAVYKLYAIIDETVLPPGVGSKVCAEFLAEMLPEFDSALRTRAAGTATL